MPTGKGDRTLCDRAADPRGDRAERGLADHRAHLGVVCGGITDNQRVRAILEQRQERVRDALGEYQPRRGGALLSRGAEGSQQYLLHGEVDVGIVENDGGVLATHFRLDRYAPRRPCRRNAPADAR